LAAERVRPRRVPPIKWPGSLAAGATALITLGLGVAGCGGGGFGGRPPAAPAARVAFVSDRDGNTEIYSMRPDGSDVRRLTTHAANDHRPAWSPDRTRITFVTDRDGDSEVYVMNADGSNAVNLTQNPGGPDGGPVWSPDGSTIAYVLGGDEIAVRPADGSGSPTVLSNNPAVDGGPVWSPDGSQIYFVSNRINASQFRLYVMNRDGTGQTAVGDSLIDGKVAISPDGSRIVYAAPIAPFQTGLFIANADGSNATRLGPDDSAEPIWAPNGQSVSFTSWRDGNSEIYAISATGSDLVRLTNTPFTDGGAAR
jgi:Tol biopolymer transport system component